MTDLGALSVRTLTDVVGTYLDAAQPAMSGYWTDGVPDTPPADGDGRSRPYWALYPMPGQLVQDNLARVVNGMLWRFQVTAAGGDLERAGDALDSVRATLTGARIPITGALVGRCTEIGDGGPIAEDRDARPSRWYGVLIYSLFITRSPA